jgi:hypothetical protein
MNHPLLFFGFIGLLLALPTLLVEKSLKRLALAFLATTFGILLPLIVFFFSAFLVPEWKGACAHGWWDCFHLGKLALTPFVLWATIALYLVEVCQIRPPKPGSLTIALFLGGVVAGGCFLYGVMTTGTESRRLEYFFLVPLYTAIWYGLRWFQSHRQNPLRLIWYLLSLLGTVPFWIAGLIWSRHIFAGLPNQAPECFVVTAANQGHQEIVGPFVLTTHRGQARIANRQLVRLWAFEQLWQKQSPRSHGWFRRSYNRTGPTLARQINSPWRADVTYLALKPLEWLALSITKLAPPIICSATAPLREKL